MLKVSNRNLRGCLYGDFSSWDEISTRFVESKFLRLYGEFHPGMKIKKKKFNENYFLNKWDFLFSSRDETWRKIMFRPGMNVSTRGQLAGM